MLTSKRKDTIFFLPDFILLKVDSLHKGDADLYVTLKEGIPQKALNIWSLGNIIIYKDYTIERIPSSLPKGKKKKIYNH